MVSVLELLLVEVESGCELLELGVFYYLEVLLLLFGVFALRAVVLGVVEAILAHLDVCLVLQLRLAAGTLGDGRHGEEVHEVGLLRARN